MPDLDELYPGRFLKGRTLTGPMTIRIVSVNGEDLEDDDNKKKLKGVLKYRTLGPPGPDGKPTIVTGEIVWNKTNALLAAAIFGNRDYASWAGHKLTIAFDPTIRLGAEEVGGIRVVGSPELRTAINVDVKRPRRRKPERYQLRPTDDAGRVRGAADAKRQAPEPPPPAEPAPNSPEDLGFRDPGQEG